MYETTSTSGRAFLTDLLDAEAGKRFTSYVMNTVDGRASFISVALNHDWGTRAEGSGRDVVASVLVDSIDPATSTISKRTTIGGTIVLNNGVERIIVGSLIRESGLIDDGNDGILSVRINLGILDSDGITVPTRKTLSSTGEGVTVEHVTGLSNEDVLSVMIPRSLGDDTSTAKLVVPEVGIVVNMRTFSRNNELVYVGRGGS